MSNLTMVPFEVDGEKVFLAVTAYSPGHPGNLSGPMENAEEPTPPEIEFDLVDAYGVVLRWALTRNQKEEAEAAIIEYLKNKEEP